MRWSRRSIGWWRMEPPNFKSYASRNLREWQVMSLVFRGFLNKQLGTELGVS